MDYPAGPIIFQMKGGYKRSVVINEWVQCFLGCQVIRFSGFQGCHVRAIRLVLPRESASQS
jgi:hypothetical protein